MDVDRWIAVPEITDGQRKFRKIRFLNVSIGETRGSRRLGVPGFSTSIRGGSFAMQAARAESIGSFIGWDEIIFLT